MKILGSILSLAYISLSLAFAPRPTKVLTSNFAEPLARKSTTLFRKISSERRKQLGILDTEDEYDLDYALNNNTDDTISKVVAGSFILVMIALLVVGLIIPYTTDYGDGVCNPILNQGRC